MQITLPDLLRRMTEQGGSDLHITTNSAPQVRVHGHLKPLEGFPPFTPAETKRLAYSVLTDAQKHRFEENMELDFSFGLKGMSRFRANLFNQRGSVGAVFRAIPYEIKTFDNLGLPMVVADMCKKPRGLVLVTGPTGSGKSTTLASMIDKINSERHEHILTVEDPIEFLHQHKNCIVNQREVNSDTHGFSDALRTALRQDPDVVLVGELRDLETIEMALRVAETGHLTFATLHTNSAASTINRIIDVFPAGQQSQIRTQLSLVLEGVLCQALLPKATGDGRVMALEILIPNSAIRNLIRDDKIHQIYSMMQTGQDKFGMQTFNQALASLYQKRLINLETAMQRSSNPDELKDLIDRGSGVNQSYGGQAQPVTPNAPAKGNGSPYAQGRPVGQRPPVR
ncbi:MAG: type IV pilus twitching motility protein PilT [Acidobacteriota bacterium]|nr:type IV pilus twitching motility protein PilT [Acidobacteriota bacterium]